MGASGRYGLRTGYHHLDFGGETPAITNNCFYTPFLSVSNAFGLDKKIDDGLADSGVMISINYHNTNNPADRCVDNNLTGTGGANYDLSQQGIKCRLEFNVDK